MSAKQITEASNPEFHDLSNLSDMEEKRLMSFPYQTKVSFKPLADHLQELQSNGNDLEQLFAEKALGEVNKYPEYLDETKVVSAIRKHPEVLAFLFSGLFTPLKSTEKFGYTVVPFSNEMLYATPEFMEVFNAGHFEISMHLTEEEMMEKLMNNAYTLILNKRYGQDLEFSFPGGVTLRNKNTGLETHYQLNPVIDFVEVRVSEPLPEVDMNRVRNQLQKPFNREAWLELFPADRFEFHGVLFIYLTDITEQQIIASIKNKLLGKEKMHLETEFDFLSTKLQSLFQLPHLEVGFQTSNLEIQQLTNLLQVLSGLSKEVHSQEALKNSIYREPMMTMLPRVFADLEDLEDRGVVEEALLKKGIRSLMLIPLQQMNEDEDQIILEIGSKIPGVFSHTQLVRFRGLMPILSAGMSRKREEMENKLRGIMQQQFTNIHPSVQWKFRQAAMNILSQQEVQQKKNVTFEPIELRHIYPLYGQADIVSSSTHRNESILSDLNLNLERVEQLLAQLSLEIKSHLIDFMAENVHNLVEELQRSFSPNDETRVLNLLRNEIHPYFRELAVNFPAEAAEKVNNYFKKLDGTLGVIYWERKAFEESVAMLNDSIARLLQEQDDEMQAILPHYFEKYKTDGVEYTIYLGQALLQNGQFSMNHLREFRLWQLKHMCEVTRLVDRLQEDLLVPLTTAQLIFVYSDALDVCFRMDEKHFDVDGAYNVRYEILKKRIDKAYILDTDERLTQAGKIAIVYLHREDRQEYMEYLQYLVREGVILPEIEDYSLSKMQGVEGLKALRVTVKLEA